jgi:hypothetical protein
MAGRRAERLYPEGLRRSRCEALDVSLKACERTVDTQPALELQGQDNLPSSKASQEALLAHTVGTIAPRLKGRVI